VLPVHNAASEADADPESLPPLPPRPSPKVATRIGGPPSDDGLDNTVLCPEPDCGELILLTDFNEHLDYHALETLSFDETTRQYRSQNPANMYDSYTPANSTKHSKPSFLEHSFTTTLPDALRRNDDGGRKVKKTARGRDSSDSEKSTLSRSMASFIPFAKFDKKAKPPPIKGKLGARLSLSSFSILC